MPDNTASGLFDLIREQLSAIPRPLGQADDLAALDSLRTRYERMGEFIAWLEPMQQRTVAMIRREGFVFETPLHKPDADRTDAERWEKLAFTLYSNICEIDSYVANVIQETVDA